MFKMKFILQFNIFYFKKMKFLFHLIIFMNKIFKLCKQFLLLLCYPIYILILFYKYFLVVFFTTNLILFYKISNIKKIPWIIYHTIYFILCLTKSITNLCFLFFVFYPVL